ncbi:hypothetical protein J6590_004972 [Homalodisca vitripennis]|nr:hypothetical protein J6590_004972 [Homalodisca vitripennis]
MNGPALKHPSSTEVTGDITGVGSWYCMKFTILQKTPKLNVHYSVKRGNKSEPIWQRAGPAAESCYYVPARDTNTESLTLPASPRYKNLP